MAKYRKTPTCPGCGKAIAKAIHRKQESWQPPFCGDTFIRWEYIKHNCKKLKKKLKFNQQ